MRLAEFLNAASSFWGRRFGGSNRSLRLSVVLTIASVQRAERLPVPVQPERESERSALV